jgi:glycosyltransferase involved in cell wall biosynthesis
MPDSEASTATKVRATPAVTPGVATVRATRYTVDVVIPVLNEAHVLEKSVATVRTFLEESFAHRWRVVIVDNGSTDGTGDIAARLAATHDDVAFYHLAKRGRGSALLHAWSRSTADVVCYTDVDLSTELAALPKIVDATGASLLSATISD